MGEGHVLSHKHTTLPNQTFLNLFSLQNLVWKKLYFKPTCANNWMWLKTCRTLTYQEVILRIGPLYMLIKAIKQKNSAVDLKWPSLQSGPILSITYSSRIFSQFENELVPSWEQGIWEKHWELVPSWERARSQLFSSQTKNTASCTLKFSKPQNFDVNKCTPPPYNHRLIVSFAGEILVLT